MSILNNPRGVLSKWLKQVASVVAVFDLARSIQSRIYNVDVVLLYPGTLSADVPDCLMLSSYTLTGEIQP